MSIIGVGIDVVDIDRFGQTLERTPRLRERLFTPAERELPLQSLAARFAAKEALVKALGTGFSQGIWLSDILIRKGVDGEPIAILSGVALERFQSLGGGSIHVSISHDRHSALAVVILERA